MIWPRAVVLALVLAAGCATGPEPAFTPIESRRGVVDWSGTANGWRREVAFARDGDGRVRILAGSDLELTRIDGGWDARGALAGRGWRGHPDLAPPRLAGWVALGEAWESAAAMGGRSSEFRNGRLSADYSFGDGELREILVVCVATGERFRVAF